MRLVAQKFGVALPERGEGGGDEAAADSALRETLLKAHEVAALAGREALQLEGAGADRVLGVEADRDEHDLRLVEADGEDRVREVERGANGQVVHLCQRVGVDGGQVGVGATGLVGIQYALQREDQVVRGCGLAVVEGEALAQPDGRGLRVRAEADLLRRAVLHLLVSVVEVDQLVVEVDGALRVHVALAVLGVDRVLGVAKAAHGERAAALAGARGGRGLERSVLCGSVRAYPGRVALPAQGACR